MEMIFESVTRTYFRDVESNVTNNGRSEAVENSNGLAQDIGILNQPKMMMRGGP